MTTTVNLRRELHDLIEIADDEWVMAIYTMLQSLVQNNKGIIGHTGSGQPLTKEALIARVRESYAAGKAGKVKTGEELLAEIQTW